MRYGGTTVRDALEDIGVSCTGDGPWVSVICPLHEDTRPSMRVHLDEGGWKCLAGCGSHGDIAELVARVRGEDSRVVRRRLLSGAARDTEALLSALTRESAESFSTKTEPLFYERGHAPAYMLRRGFTLDTLRAWNVGWDPETRSVVIPVTADGALVGLIRRRLEGEPKYQYSAGFRRDDVLFGLDMVPPDATTAVLVEGSLDAMWLHQHGFNGVAILGSSLSRQQAALLTRRFWEVVLAFDADNAGAAATRRAAAMLTRVRLRVAALPPGRKDIQECSQKEIEKAIYTAREPWYYGHNVGNMIRGM